MANGGTGAGRRAVTAFFDDRAAAQKAVDDLAAADVARDRVTLVEGAAPAAAAEPVPTPDKGLWETVKDLFMADEDRHAYGEGLRRGGFLLSVMVDGDEPRVVEILDREGAVDMDARAGDWELEGWDPARASADLRAASAADRPAEDVRTAGALATPPSALSPAEVQAAVEPVGAVGPAFAPGEAPARPASAPSIRRDAEAGGLRLRTYIESHDHPDAMR